MKFAVFTASIGPTDQVKAPDRAFPEVDYLAFVGRGVLVPQPWRRIEVDAAVGHEIGMARKLKILAHRTLPEYDMSLWIDAAFQLQCDPVGLLHYTNTSVMAFEHPDRTNIIQEAMALDRYGIVTSAVTVAQMDGMGHFPEEQRHLTATGFLFRLHTPSTNRFNERWYTEFERGQHYRDQMSVDYAAHQTGIDIQYFPGNYRDNRFSKWHAHRR